MVFSSAVFLFLFLPFTLIVHYLLGPLFRNFFLLIMSVVFYAWGEGSFTYLIAASILVNYMGGLLIGWFRQEKPALAKPALAFFIVINLLVLIYYKYFAFLLSGLQQVHLIEPAAGVAQARHLPIGISFYTFHILSYLIDVYRRDAVPQKNPLDLGLYIFLFPQLVAGPIIRYKDISAKIASRYLSGSDFTNGAILFIRGLAKKMIIANTMALVADKTFSEPPAELPASMAWVGIIAYTLQIYFDFSGYSDMALGLGKMLGFNFPENFNHPYIARSIREFWQRWHISLSTWFRDYLYIPLGGNQKSKWRTYCNLFIVFFITGLWHGASLNFIVWGLFHGCFLVIERIGFGSLLQKLPKVLQHVYTLLVVVIAWVFFRANDLEHAMDYLKQLFGFGHSSNYIILLHLNNYVITVFVLALVFCTNIRQAVAARLGARFNAMGQSAGYVVVRYVVYLLLFFYSTIELAQHSYNPFIYFRF